MPRNPIIFCKKSEEFEEKVRSYVQALRKIAPKIGDHGLPEKEFWDSGLFHSAIEHIRGTQSATLGEKKKFVELVLNKLKQSLKVKKWEFVGSSERHDYEVLLSDGRNIAIETKGCLDGNNTNIFQRPPQADEFIIWSLCQNPGADPNHNAWSGVHTRLGAEVIHKKQKVDGVIIWDMVCGTIGRPCPKLLKDAHRGTKLTQSQVVPPPCIYLFPKTIPDPRSNPSPVFWKIEEVKFLHALWLEFKGLASDVIEVKIEARMKEADIQRKTSFYREGQEISSSKWTTIKRATA
ncbi:hypothetical protein [Nitrospina watsonii]|uniref:Restriction endonuclease n=1 Tax=Nitrospina watsonii TaxID=1323948 RepID=A0ABN8VYT6_9BACT|nr:hypothetical protein [Nitrospina watsonii]CAI2718934.1 conserved protein of unknown function [Nitrospina watsonii]